VPLARAVELTGARSEAELIADVAAVAGLWMDPASAEDVVDVYVEDGEVHVTYAQVFGAPPAFSLAEGAVLLAALLPFEKDGAKPVKDAIRKLRKAVPEELRPEAERLARGLDVVREPPGPWAGALREAIEGRVEAVLEYRAVADAAASRRTVEPRLLLHRDGQWYLAAWNVEKTEEHLFRLDRIVSVELGTRVFGEHKGPPVARYARRNLYFESGAEREVTLRFGGTSARLARERWGERARAEPDDAVVVPMKVTPGNYLFGVVLGHGGDATVEGPADVVEKFQERVAELARLYAG
jgi:proteasome accessory factor C